MHGVLRFGPKQASAPRRKNPISFNQQDICGICKAQVSRYTCPKCNLHYCSLQCYRSPQHGDCTESFDRSSLVSDIESAPGQTQQQKQAMMEILNKFESDSLQQDELNDGGAEDNDLADKLNGVDLDSLSPEELLQLLSPDDRAAFHASLASKGRTAELVAREVEPDTPWWEAERAGQTGSDGGLPEDDAESERHSFSCRPTMISSTDMPVVPGGAENHIVDLRYNLLALILAYAFAVRTSGVEAFENATDSARDMLDTLRLLADCVPFLFEHSTLKLGSAQEAVEYVASRAPANSLVGSSLSTVIEDGLVLLTPDNVSVIGPGSDSQPASCLSKAFAALSDLHLLVQRNDLVTRGSRSTSRLGRSGIASASRKVLFYASIVSRYQVGAPDVDALKQVTMELARVANGREMDKESDRRSRAIEVPIRDNGSHKVRAKIQEI
ncbi:hypothetical protein ACM66B_002152 [Microbotryomycetes sp. NB124-2]